VVLTDRDGTRGKVIDRTARRSRIVAYKVTRRRRSR
jgi:hypothetical protein